MPARRPSMLDRSATLGRRLAPAPTDAPPAVGGLHALQRSAGNRAMRDLLDGRDSPFRRAVEAAGMRKAAVAGSRTPTVALPFADTIRKSFGGHLPSGARAHVGGAASASAEAMDARAYASGDDLVFAGTPTLHDTAHEAAHLVQQQAGQLPAGGIGRPGDPLERNADAVADRVVAGQSAAPLLDPIAGDHGSAPAGPAAIQRVKVSWTGQGGLQTETIKVKHKLVSWLEDRFRERDDLAAAYEAIIAWNGEVGKFQRVKPRDIDNYIQPSSGVAARILASIDDPPYLSQSTVNTGDLVYGRSEARDRYIDSTPGGQKAYNVVDDLNNEFLGVNEGQTYPKASGLSLSPPARAFKNDLEQQRKSPADHPTGNKYDVNARLRRASKHGIVYTATKGRTIRFVLDGIDMDDVVGKTHRDDKVTSSGKYRAYTGSELRSLYRLRNNLAIISQVEFYNAGRRVDPPWVTNPELWRRYEPKSERVSSSPSFPPSGFGQSPSFPPSGFGQSPSFPPSGFGLSSPSFGLSSPSFGLSSPFIPEPSFDPILQAFDDYMRNPSRDVVTHVQILRKLAQQIVNNSPIYEELLYELDQAEWDLAEYQDQFSDY